MLSWQNRFFLLRGPALGLRNPWPSGFAYRLKPSFKFPNSGISLDWEKAQERLNQYHQSTLKIYWFSWAMLSVAFLAILMWELRFGFWMGWVLLIGAFLFLHGKLIHLFFLAHQYLYPEEKGSRRNKFILCLFSPWQSSRAMDLLGEDLFNGFHPFAVAYVLLGVEERNKFYRRWLLELKYPAANRLDKSQDPLILKTNRDQELKSLACWMVERGLNYQASLPSPMPATPSHKSYCPRCESSYTVEKGRCNDCGLGLVNF